MFRGAHGRGDDDLGRGAQRGGLHAHGQAAHNERGADVGELRQPRDHAVHLRSRTHGPGATLPTVRPACMPAPDMHAEK